MLPAASAAAKGEYKGLTAAPGTNASLPSTPPSLLLLPGAPVLCLPTQRLSLVAAEVSEFLSCDRPADGADMRSPSLAASAAYAVLDTASSEAANCARTSPASAESSAWNRFEGFKCSGLALDRSWCAAVSEAVSTVISEATSPSAGPAERSAESAANPNRPLSDVASPFRLARLLRRRVGTWHSSKAGSTLDCLSAHSTPVRASAEAWRCQLAALTVDEHVETRRGPSGAAVSNDKAAQLPSHGHGAILCAVSQHVLDPLFPP
mmetsp:Transcript_18342/g.55239  ORF Transcript_18342/g.55239 Transcript_18342/m.55239 type:complete len:264 (-) Transcript_18342:75-866(-)